MKELEKPRIRDSNTLSLLLRECSFSLCLYMNYLGRRSSPKRSQEQHSLSNLITLHSDIFLAYSGRLRQLKKATTQI